MHAIVFVSVYAYVGGYVSGHNVCVCIGGCVYAHGGSV